MGGRARRMKLRMQAIQTEAKGAVFCGTRQKSYRAFTDDRTGREVAAGVTRFVFFGTSPEHEPIDCRVTPEQWELFVDAPLGSLADIEYTMYPKAAGVYEFRLVSVAPAKAAGRAAA